MGKKLSISRRLSILFFGSIFTGVLWGVWKGGFLEGIIYGSIVFVLLIAIEGFKGIQDGEEN